MANIKKELSEEDLKQVTGGGSGTIPLGGIAFESYDTLMPEFYYSQKQDFTEVVYIYEISNVLYYTREAFVVDPSTNSWNSHNRSSGSAHPIENVQGFMSRYIYKLNVYIGK